MADVGMDNRDGDGLMTSAWTGIHYLHRNNSDDVYMLGDLHPLIFCCIPSHIGITGNEKANQTSKSALSILNITAYPYLILPLRL